MKIYFIILNIVLLALVGCSSGGGGGGKGGGGGNFTISGTTLDFNLDKSAGISPQGSFSGSVTGVNQNVHILIEHSNAGIDRVEFELNTETTGILNIIGRQSNELNEGVYEDWVRVSLCYDANCSRHVGGSPRTISVTYQVTDTFKVSVNAMQFSGTAGGGQIDIQPLQITGTNSNWTATTTAEWLTLDITSGNGNTVVQATANSSGLGIGNHPAEIRFFDTVSGDTQTVSVTYQLTAPSLQLLISDPLVFNGSVKQDLVLRTITLFLPNVESPMAWHLADIPDWIQLSNSEGTIGGSAGSSDLELTIDPHGLQGEQYSSDLTFIVDINGTPVSSTLPVSLTLEAARLEAEKVAVAFTAIDDIQHLSDVISIRNSRNLPSSWTAQVDYLNANESWLSAQAAGDTLSLVAAPDGLTDGLHYASVVITSAQAAQETVKVGLYVNRALQPQPITTHAATPNINGHTYLVSDPLRPYIYYSELSNLITAVNQYTGEVAFTITGMGGDLRSLTVSLDGTTLYALDHANRTIARADLTSNTVLPPLQPEGFENCDYCTNPLLTAQLKSTRIGGKNALLTGGLQVIDPDTGAIINTHIPGVSTTPAGTYFPRNSIVEVSGDGSIAFDAETGTSSPGISRYVLGYNSTTNQFTAAAIASRFTSSLAGFSSDYNGEKLYRSCDYDSRTAAAYRGSDLMPLYESLPTVTGGALVLDDNHILCKKYYGDTTPDLWVLDLTEGSIIQEYQLIGELQSRNFAISSDGQRIIARTEDGVLHFLAR